MPRAVGQRITSARLRNGAGGVEVPGGRDVPAVQAGLAITLIYYLNQHCNVLNQYV